MDAASLHALKVIVVPVHEVHGTDKERVPVEFPERVKVLPDECLSDQLPELCSIALITFLDRVMQVFDPLDQCLVFIDSTAFF